MPLTEGIGECTCPTCFNPFWHRDLKPNVAINNLVECYHGLKRESEAFFRSQQCKRDEAEPQSQSNSEQQKAHSIGHSDSAAAISAMSGSKRKFDSISDISSPLDSDFRSVSLSVQPSDIVICSSGLIESEFRELVRSARSLPCRFQFVYDVSVTHLIVPLVSRSPRLTRRTLKYLLAMLDGKFIVSLDWVRSGFLSRAFPSEARFEIEGDTNSGQSFGPRRARAGNQRLFEGLEFSLFGDFGAKDPSEQDLITLIEKAGGRIRCEDSAVEALRQARRDANYSSCDLSLPEVPASADRLLLVRPDFASHVESPFLYRLLSRSGLTVLSLVWVFDSISQFAKQDFSRYQFHVKQKST